MKIKTKFTRFNDWLAIQLNDKVLTMGVFYLFFFYGFLQPIFPAYTSQLTFLSNWPQLWLLPVLGVATKLANKAAERRAQKTYEMIKAELDIMRDVIKKIDAYFLCSN